MQGETHLAKHGALQGWINRLASDVHGSLLERVPQSLGHPFKQFESFERILLPKLAGCIIIVAFCVLESIAFGRRSCAARARFAV